MEIEEAQRLAAAEGIALIPSNNVTGFRHVAFDNRKPAKKAYHAHMARDTGTTKQFDLGSFTTAAEAALAVARHFGPRKSCAEAAKTPKAPNGSKGASHCRHDEDDAVSVIASIATDSDDDDDAQRINLHDVGTASVNDFVFATSRPSSRKRSAPEALNPCLSRAKKVTTEHEIVPSNVRDGVAHIKVEVPAGMRASARVTIEWRADQKE
jgi:hypothetical protein